MPLESRRADFLLLLDRMVAELVARRIPECCEGTSRLEEISKRRNRATSDLH